mgnify:CR=1 FL=1
MHTPISVTITPANAEHVTVLMEALKAILATTAASATPSENKTKKSKGATPERMVSTPAEAAPDTLAVDVVATVDLVTVRARLAELSKAGKAEQVKSLIAALGATKLTDIDPARYAELMEKAGAL